MVLSYIVSKLPSKCLYNVDILKNKLQFGNIKFQINKNIVYLNNIEVIQKNKGNGSHILINFENYVKYNYNVNEIHLLAWQKNNNHDVLNFFKKHGYYHTDLEKKIKYMMILLIYTIYIN
jgi:hypothetical protein